MRNRYPADCSQCGGHIKADEGILERVGASWLVRHEKCPAQPRELRCRKCRQTTWDGAMFTTLGGAPICDDCCG